MSHVLSCRCGAVKGVVSQTTRVNRVVCYCRDCQAFAHFLGQTDTVLDAAGGTDIVQIAPANVTITQGQSRLACIRLTPKGLLRWYADCCNTPVGNTPASINVSIVGLVHSCLDAEGEPLEPSFGPLRMWVHTQGATQPPAHKATGSLRILARLLPMVLGARLSVRHQSTPFFSPVTGSPVVTPRVLNGGEHERLYAKVDGRPAAG